jgi:hypothetical protein
VHEDDAIIGHTSTHDFIEFGLDILIDGIRARLNH